MKRTELLIAALTMLVAACATQGTMKLERILLVEGGEVRPGSDLEVIERGAVVIRGDRIAWVGPVAEVPEWGRSGEVIDASEMIVLPGLVDAHAHVAGLGAALDSVDLVGTTSYEEVIRRIAAATSDVPAGEWILGRGWDQNDWPVQQFPTARPLDAAVGDHPVWVRRIDGHAALASSAAMRAARITASSPDPEGGRIERDAAGNPTGVFVDAAMDLIDRIIPPPSRTVRRQRILDAARLIAAHGLTAVHDAGVDQDTIQLMRELIDAGELPIRVYVMLQDDDELLSSWFERGPLVDYGDQLTVRAVKLYADGALGSRGAALIEPYADDPGNRGLMVSSGEHLERRAKAALAAGFQVGAHAIGDRGVRTVLDAFEAARVTPAHRFRIEHLQVVAPSDFARVARMGVIGSVQPTHATSDMPWAEARLASERVKGAYAWRTVLDAGGRLALGSDFPVEEVSPLLGIHAAVTRQDLDGHPPGGWFPDQRLSVREAIRGFTLDAAYAAFEEERRGSIEEGKFADLTILQADGRAPAPRQISSSRVRYTIVNGRVVHRGE
ncbi:MAG TPA: amidohydrolase [Thermoanaerobaculia bacterium]|nr:amidohydrolase [Thermoanaerobaculia bacterium]